MKPLTRVAGAGCPLGLASVDTDQLIPARFMKRPRSEGYGGYLLHDLRRDEAGAENPDFPLNRPGWREAPILVARRNFGSGSSREAAVYALADHGVRVVLAPTFGDIFASNAVKNELGQSRGDLRDRPGLARAVAQWLGRYRRDAVFCQRDRAVSRGRRRRSTLGAAGRSVKRPCLLPSGR
jgi:hypothetical protein